MSSPKKKLREIWVTRIGKQRFRVPVKMYLSMRRGGHYCCRCGRRIGRGEVHAIQKRDDDPIEDVYRYCVSCVDWED